MIDNEIILDRNAVVNIFDFSIYFLIMVNKCYICGSSNSEASLFAFPKNEPILRKWKEFAGIVDDKISTSKLCHRHFKDDGIKATPESTSEDSNCTLKKHRRRLIPNAVPALKFDDKGSSVGRDSMTTVLFTMENYR